MLVNELILKLQELKAERGNVRTLIHFNDEEVDVLGAEFATQDDESFIYIW